MTTRSVIKILLDTVVDELGILRPNGYVGAQDIQARQLVALFHQVGDYIVDQADWQVLIKMGLFNTAPNTQAYALPADWVAFIDETMWNRTAKVKVHGPRNQSDWAAADAIRVGSGPYFVQQLRNDQIFLQPVPTDYHQISYYYLSGDWIQTATGHDDRATSDNDKTVWSDDRMIIMGVKAAWLRSKRLSYDEEAKQFEDQIRANASIDRGAQDLSMDPSQQQAPPYGVMVPAGNWGVP